jgi:cobalt-zinc-cadmium efflux system protein
MTLRSFPEKSESIDDAHHHDLPVASNHEGRTRRALVWALGLNFGFLLIEATIGLVTGSLALLSDAAHMVSDVASLALALGAAHLATRIATADRSYGYRRAEVLGALLNGLAMLIVIGTIAKEAVIRLLGEVPTVSAWPVLVAGTVGLVINLGSAWWLAKADRDNLNVRGALLHMLADALGSLGAIAAAIGLWLGWYAADAVVALFVAALVLWGTVRLLRDTLRVLMEFAPTDGASDRIREALTGLDGVVRVHDVHLWSLDGRERILTAHLVRRPEAHSGELLQDANCLLEDQFSVRHATLQIEHPDTCCDGVCTLNSGAEAEAGGHAHG